MNSESRLSVLAVADPDALAIVSRLIGVAIDGLPQMLHPDGAFAHTRRGVVVGDRAVLRLEGRSERYTAIVILGARHLDEIQQKALLGGRTAAESATELARRLGPETGMGDLALAAWAVAETGGDRLPNIIPLLDAAIAQRTHPVVVEQAWAVSAYVAARASVDVEAQLAGARQLLLDCQSADGGLFPHGTRPGAVPRWRAHVGCFADQVYPIQALARLHVSGYDEQALAAAQACADRICALQGPAGQWWWHYDARNGRVLEGYPVYSVHQHAMAPMALLDLVDAGGSVDLGAIAAGVRWMVERPESDEAFIRADLGVTWRKVARRDPRKLVRAARAVSSAAAPKLPQPGLDAVMKPAVIDRECRPYEFGWLLDTWGGRTP